MSTQVGIGQGASAGAWTASKAINIYTDGACSGNQFSVNRGGWGAVLEYGEHVKEIYGGERNTTNNRMEITAMIEALSALKVRGGSVNVFSDSSYVIECIRKKWYEGWMRGGWLTANKRPVENRDLWERLIPLLSLQDYRFYLVKGHIGAGAREETKRKGYARFIANNGTKLTYEEYLYITAHNNRADELARRGAEEQI